MVTTFYVLVIIVIAQEVSLVSSLINLGFDCDVSRNMCSDSVILKKRMFGLLPHFCHRAPKTFVIF